MKDYSVKKIANAIIYFIDNKVFNLGSTKLMKLCFYADKYHLEKHGTPIFKYSYTKKEFGPVPLGLYSLVKASICGVSEYDDFIEETKIFNKYVNIESKCYGENNSKTMTLFTKQQDFDSKFFSKTQLNILDRVIEEFKSSTAFEISELSHETKAWKDVDFDDEITYSSMVESQEQSNYIAFLENEKSSFYASYRISKLNLASIK